MEASDDDGEPAPVVRSAPERGSQVLTADLAPQAVIGRYRWPLSVAR